MLCLSSGAPGCGKSSQHKFLASVLPQARYLCLEYKDIDMLEGSGVNYTIIEKFDDNFIEDPIATLAALEMEIHEIIHKKDEAGKPVYRNVVVDGVSDIRSFATKEWIYRDNMERKRRAMPQRETISGENKSAWHDINERTKGLLRPLINWANVTRNNVFFTAQLKDNYVNDKKAGKIINIGEWCEYDVDVKIEFMRPALDRYVLRFTKLPDWSNDTGVYEIDVEKNGLIAALAERKLIR